MQVEQLKTYITDALDEIKAEDIRELNIAQITDIADYMIIATGRSDRHCKAIADSVMEKLLQYDRKPIGKEGLTSSQWIVIDFADVVVHIMRSQTRELYDLESLWDENVHKLLAAHKEGRLENN